MIVSVSLCVWWWRRWWPRVLEGHQKLKREHQMASLPLNGRVKRSKGSRCWTVGLDCVNIPTARSTGPRMPSCLVTLALELIAIAILHFYVLVPL